MNLRFLILPAVIVIPVVGCVPKTETPWPVSRVEAIKEMQAAADAWSRAFSAGDPDAIAGQMTEETMASPVDVADVEGRENARVFFQTVVENHKAIAYDFDVVEAEIYGDVAYDRGTFRWESIRQGQVTEGVGRYSAVRHRGSDGVWRIHRFIENEAPGRNRTTS